MTGLDYLLAAASIPLAFLLGFVPMGVWVWRLSNQAVAWQNYAAKLEREIQQWRSARAKIEQARILAEAKAHRLAKPLPIAMSVPADRVADVKAILAGYPCENCDRLLPEPSVTMLCEDCEERR